jgi:hypothetical protein
MLFLTTRMDASNGQTSLAIRDCLGRASKECEDKYAELRTRTLKPSMTMDELKQAARKYPGQTDAPPFHLEINRLCQFRITRGEVDELMAEYDIGRIEEEARRRMEEAKGARLEEEAKGARLAIQAKLAVQATPFELQRVNSEWPTPYVCVVVAGLFKSSIYKIKSDEFPWTPAQMSTGRDELFNRGELKTYLESKAKPLTTRCYCYDPALLLCVDECTLFIATGC